MASEPDSQLGNTVSESTIQQRQLDERRRVSRHRQQRYNRDQYRQERRQQQTYRTSYDHFRTDAEENEYRRYIHSLWSDYDEFWEEEVQERLLDQYNSGTFNNREQWEQQTLFEFENFQDPQQSPIYEEQLEDFFRLHDTTTINHPIQKQGPAQQDRSDQE